MGFRKEYRKYVDVKMDARDREALGGKHVGWNEHSGPYFYDNRQKILLHRWIYDRVLTEEMQQQGWEKPRVDLAFYNIRFQDGNKKNCHRDNLFCDIPTVDERQQPEQIEPPRCNSTHGSLPCKKGIGPIIVRAEDYAVLVDKHLMWNSGRGAFFYEGGQRVYVHRFIFERMCQEEMWYAELQLLPKSIVGFIDNDPTFCDRDNLFIWSCDSQDPRQRRKAKEEARLIGIEWHRQRHELLEKWRKEDEKKNGLDSV